MGSLISKAKLIQHLEQEGGMNIPEWLRENIENAPTEKVYVVTYQDEMEEPVVTVFDNREAAEKCLKVFAKTHNRAILDHCPVFTQMIIKGEDEE